MDAIATRLAVNGTPQQFDTLRPKPRPVERGRAPAPDDYDETGLAEELASLGFVLVDPKEGEAPQ